MGGMEVTERGIDGYYLTRWKLFTALKTAELNASLVCGSPFPTAQGQEEGLLGSLRSGSESCFCSVLAHIHTHPSFQAMDTAKVSSFPRLLNLRGEPHRLHLLPKILWQIPFLASFSLTWRVSSRVSTSRYM